MPPRRRREPLPGLQYANAHFVTPRIAVGGDLAPRFGPARRQLDELVAAGVTHIVDLRDEWSDEALVAAWAPEVSYLHHRVEDAGQRIPAVWFEELAEWVEDALAEPGTKVLVHCHMGVNRAPSAVFALLLSQGWTVRAALTAIRTRREVAVIDYADDALDWHLARSGATRYVRAGARRSLTLWRTANKVDKLAVIRQLRAAEGSASAWCIGLDPEAVEILAEVADAQQYPAVAFAIDHEPDDLAMRDQVLLWARGDGGGVVGSGLVVGPPRPGQEGTVTLPVVLLGFDTTPMLPAGLLSLATPAGTPLPGEAPNPERLDDAQLTALALAVRLESRVSP